MAHRGRRVTFHGAFSSKAAARRKEHLVEGFIQARTIRGARRYVVLTANDNPRRDAREHAPAPGVGGWGFVPLAAIAAGLWFIFGGRPRAAAPATELSSATVWIADAFQGGSGQLATGAAPPGPSPPWREASQAEIQSALAAPAGLF